MKLKYLDSVYLVTSSRCNLVFQGVLTMLRRGCVTIDYSSIQIRLSYSVRLTSARRQSQLPSTPLRVVIDYIYIYMVSSSTSVQNLGFYIDANLSGRTQVIKTTASCFAALRHLRGVRRYLPTDIFKSLVVSLILSRLDYGNAVLCGLPQHQYRRLQSVLHAAARSIYNLRWYRTALAERSRSSQLQGQHAGLPLSS